jgi:hypothetical protein
VYVQLLHIFKILSTELTGPLVFILFTPKLVYIIEINLGDLPTKRPKTVGISWNKLKVRIQPNLRPRDKKNLIQKLVRKRQFYYQPNHLCLSESKHFLSPKMYPVRQLYNKSTWHHVFNLFFCNWYTFRVCCVPIYVSRHNNCAALPISQTQTNSWAKETKHKKKIVYCSWFFGTSAIKFAISFNKAIIWLLCTNLSSIRFVCRALFWLRLFGFTCRFILTLLVLWFRTVRSMTSINKLKIYGVNYEALTISQECHYHVIINFPRHVAIDDKFLFFIFLNTAVKIHEKIITKS